MIEAENEAVKDFVGQPITTGCQVAYPVRRGSSMWMTVMRVTQVTQIHPTKPPYLIGYNNEGRRVNVHNLKNVIVVPTIAATANLTIAA